MTLLRPGGVPWHPALIHFPIVAWTLTLVADGTWLATGIQTAWVVAYWATAVGVIAALAAMAAGFLDYAQLAVEHPARAAVERHMLFMGITWTVFLADLLVRDLEQPTSWPVLLTVVGFALLAVGAHLGGRLVYQQGVNVQLDSS